MLAKKYPELKKPIRYAKKMSLLEKWRDIQFHKNLAKIDEINLHLQWEIDAREKGRTEGLAEGRTEGLAEGRVAGLAEGRTEGQAEGRAEIARKMKELGYTKEDIIAVTGLSAD